MARNKNALRGHFVQAYVPGTETPGTEWLELAKYIVTVEADNNEETEDEGYYDGDGTPETDVTSVAVGYSFAGYRDHEDAAQNLIAAMEFEVGAGRKLWHRRISADGLTQHEGLATASAIITDGGDATAYETFECNIRWDRKPTKTTLPVVP